MSNLSPVELMRLTMVGELEADTLCCLCEQTCLRVKDLPLVFTELDSHGGAGSSGLCHFG